MYNRLLVDNFVKDSRRTIVCALNYLQIWFWFNSFLCIFDYGYTKSFSIFMFISFDNLLRQIKIRDHHLWETYRKLQFRNSVHPTCLYFKASKTPTIFVLKASFVEMLACLCVLTAALDKFYKLVHADLLVLLDCTVREVFMQ